MDLSQIIQNVTGKSVVNLSLYANNGIKSYEILLKTIWKIIKHQTQ